MTCSTRVSGFRFEASVQVRLVPCHDCIFASLSPLPPGLAADIAAFLQLLPRLPAALTERGRIDMVFAT